ncbi:transmembrane Mn(2+) transporter, partial [bacterium]|nr:transmembrane Mn(2+) transporter [bacterium]
LVTGRYRMVERLCIAMVVFFTLFTVYALCSVQTTEFAISGADVLSGLSFEMPNNFTTAFVAFGIIGVGASELIYYPYWCLEKGYARNAGDQSSAEWGERALGWIRVMKVDAWVSMAIYTGATIAFYLLGATILHRKGITVESEDMIGTLSQMYTGSIGGGGAMFFIVGATCVLFSTVFAATAANARLLSDALELYGVRKRAGDENKARNIKICAVVLAMASMGLALSIKQPVWLVFAGAAAQGIMLPFLAGGAIYLTIKRTDIKLKPSQGWMVCLYISAACMAAVGLYQVVDKIIYFFGN